MKKNFASLFLVLALVFGAFAAPAMAAATGIPLHQGTGPFDWKDYLSGGFETGANIQGTGNIFWHFVNPDKLGGYANITFRKPGGTYTFRNVLPYKAGQHFGVVTLPSWQLMGAEYFPAGAIPKNGTRFNLSHTASNLGSLRVKADVTKEHEEVTWQKFYKRTVQDFYVRDVQCFWERDVQCFYKRTVQDFYARSVQCFLERDVQDFYQREYCDRYQPVFEKKVSRIDDTLVSAPGTAWNNGHTYRTAEVGKSYTVPIVTNRNYEPTGFSYKLSVGADSLTVTLGSGLLSASVAVKVFSTPPDQAPPGAHTLLGPGGSVTAALPEGHGDTVYVYVHFAGISWYTTGDYEFVEWRFKDTVFGDHALVRTDTGEYRLVRTETGEYKLVRTVIGDYRLVKTVIGDYRLARTVIGDYRLVRTVTGIYVLKETREISRQTIQDPYDAEFDLVVRNAADEVVFSGKIANKGEVFIPHLLPGVYTATLNGADITQQVKSAAVVLWKTSEIVFDGIKVIGGRVNVYLDPVKTDYKLPDVRTNYKLPDVRTDNRLPDVKMDYKLPDVRTDCKLPDVKADNRLPDVYLDDLKLPDVRLGDETDPYGEWAIRLN
ncbi:MAG TPA: hypothetical protein VLA21_03090 [Candidatus Limnocylindria bacterium]|nr:hypothetical protein [Candidatus Limnocylindria bacterium]